MDSNFSSLTCCSPPACRSSIRACCLSSWRESSSGFAKNSNTCNTKDSLQSKVTQSKIFAHICITKFVTLFIKNSSWRFLKWFNYDKNLFQVMIMLIYNVLVWYERYFKIFKHLLKQDSVDQNGVFMTRHLPSQERKQNSYLSGLQDRKKSLLILYHAHLKIQKFVMFFILSKT